jgi:nicotinate phosphoribosyltransferase
MVQDSQLPEGIYSLLDTDLYKLTMHCCVLKYFPNVQVTYKYTNRTPHMKFTRSGYRWLQKQIDNLANIVLTKEELQFLRTSCVYLSESYLQYLSTFRLYPSKQVHLSFQPSNDTGSDDDVGDIDLHTTGTWLDTILYEIPLLALISETYFKFVDRDWSYDGQVERARDKGVELLKNGCLFSEFGSRRRRDYHTHDLVLEGLKQAQVEATRQGWSGKLSGTSNVHFAMRHNLPPIGTVAHEWFMGVAAVTDDYENANETALRYWVETYGKGVLGIALTDTFGTPDFLKAFKKQIPVLKMSKQGQDLPLPSYAEVFTGVRQDSGDPETFAKTMHKFYDEQGIKSKKAVVFSDSLNVELCLRYKKVAEELNLQPSFGVGTFFTNDFVRISTGHKSVPLNIVIKISTAGGRAAVKISDNIGKNTGDKATVADVKRRLGYTEHEWKDGDESTRWGKEEDDRRKSEVL